MKKSISLGVLVGCLIISSVSLADDAAMSGDKAKLMKQCMDKQKSANAGMTQAAMETVCKNEAQKQKDGNDLATGTKNDNPPKQ
jgi:hypothetical protein